MSGEDATTDRTHRMPCTIADQNDNYMSIDATKEIEDTAMRSTACTTEVAQQLTVACLQTISPYVYLPEIDLWADTLFSPVVCTALYTLFALWRQKPKSCPPRIAQDALPVVSGQFYWTSSGQMSL